MKLELPKKYRLPVALLLLSGILLTVVGWQVEICTIWISECRPTFEFPFFIGGSVNVYWARDFWYAVNGLSWLMTIYSGYQLGKR